MLVNTAADRNVRAPEKCELRPTRKRPATDAKEVGGEPAEETFCHRTVSLMPARAAGGNRKSDFSGLFAGVFHRRPGQFFW